MEVFSGDFLPDKALKVVMSNKLLVALPQGEMPVSVLVVFIGKVIWRIFQKQFYFCRVIALFENTLSKILFGMLCVQVRKLF